VCAASTTDQLPHRTAPSANDHDYVRRTVEKVPLGFGIDARGVRQSVAWLMPSDRNRSNPVDRASLILKFKAY
jgi:hypothetical protein